MKPRYQGKSLPAHSLIRQYWADHLHLGLLGFDSRGEFLDPGICFACGLYVETGEPERAHILAKSRGGSNAVTNLHLLCHCCHAASEGLSGRLYWEWLYGGNMVDRIFQFAAHGGARLWTGMTDRGLTGGGDENGNRLYQGQR